MKVSDKIDADFKEIVDEIHDNVRLGKSVEDIRKKLRRWCSDEAIERGISLYRERYSGALGGGALLRGNKSKDRMNWYHPVETPAPNSAWGKLKRVLSAKGWAAEHIHDLDLESNAVVSNLSAPIAEPQCIKGLVLGYVQSGKTANFSAVIAKATDEGYRLVIVLSGLYNNLRCQTEARLQSELTAPHGGSNSFTLTSADENGDFKAPPFEPNAVLDSGKFVLAVIKKNSTRFDVLTEWLSKANQEILSKCPVLIIDDEADQASINNSKKDVSAINSRIRTLIGFLSTHCSVSYVGYTATPFANILIDADEADDLFPTDFIYSLRAPDTYVGAERLFGRDTINGDSGDDGLDVVRIVPPTDILPDDASKPAKHLSGSMKIAIQSFLLAGAERVRRGQVGERDHITMLVNTTHLTDEHSNMCSLIERIQKNLLVGIDEGDERILGDLREIWTNDFERVARESFQAKDVASFDDLFRPLKIFASGLRPPIKENSKSQTRLNFKERTWAIVVGGNTLSRGLTIEGLTISYFHRTTNGYDTLLQMGRWFGYRPNYLDVTRIFVTEEMASNFFHLATVERELREDIARMEQNEERPIDIALKIRDHDRMDITLKRVLKTNSVFASNTYSGSKISATHVDLENAKLASDNFACIRNLLTSVENGGFRSENHFQEFSRCLLYKKVPASIVCDFLRTYQFSPADTRFTFGILSPYIDQLVQRGELTKWSVAIMSQKQTIADHMIDLGVNNLKVYAVERRHMQALSSERRDLGVAIKSVTSFRDELIDLGHLSSNASVQKYMDQGNGERNIVAIRNSRSSENPLLLIYPLYTNWQKSRKEREELAAGRKFLPIISDIRALFAITLVFPPTKQTRFNFNYIANASVVRRERATGVA